MVKALPAAAIAVSECSGDGGSVASERSGIDSMVNERGGGGVTSMGLAGYVWAQRTS